MLPIVVSAARSGCGISPTTVPSSLQTPATFQTEPFGFAPGGDLPGLRRVPEDDLVALPELAEKRRLDVVAPLAVGDRHLEDLAPPEPPGERALGLLDGDVGPLAPELEALVPQKRPGQEARLAEDLEAVAAPEHQPAAGHEARQRLDDRRAARHGARPQIVAVGEAARKDQAIETVDIGVPVPHVLDRLVEHLGDDVVEIHVTPRAREDHDAESHEASCSDEVAVTPPCEPPEQILLRGLRAAQGDAVNSRADRRRPPPPRRCSPRPRGWRGASGTSRRVAGARAPRRSRRA